MHVLYKILWGSADKLDFLRGICGKIQLNYLFRLKINQYNKLNCKRSLKKVRVKLRYGDSIKKRFNLN